MAAPATAPTPAARSPSARRATPRPPLRHRAESDPAPLAAAREHYELVRRRSALGALARRHRRGRPRRRSTPRRRASIRCRREHRRHLARRRAGPRVLHPARASLRRRAARSSIACACSRGSRRGSPTRRRRSSARTSSTTSTCSPTTASRSRGVAHDTLLESYVLESHKPHDMDNLAWRHLDVKTITLRRRRRARAPSAFRSSRWRVERATEYAAEDADVTLRLHHALYPRSQRDAKLRARLRARSSCRCATCCSAWSATAC